MLFGVWGLGGLGFRGFGVSGLGALRFSALVFRILAGLGFRRVGV